MADSVPSSESNNLEFYDRESAEYDQGRWTSPGGRFTNAVQLQIVADLSAEWATGRILDVGAGTGRFTALLARQRNKMTLLDVSNEMLVKARSNLHSAALAGQIDALVQGSVYELPFKEASFDHAVALNVFSHLESPAEALGEMARVLSPGSRLIFNYSNYLSYYLPAARRVNAQSRAMRRDVYSVWRNPSDIADACESAGIEIVATVGHTHIPVGLDRPVLRPLIKAIDSVSRTGPLAQLAPVQYCLGRRR